MTYPAIFFEGGDGVGKTTQALLWSLFLRDEYKIPVAYISYPVYETACGQIIGRCLSRWGESQAIDLLPPEDMAKLFALNRAETIPHLRRLIEQKFLLVFNRGPLSGLFSVARQAMVDGVSWDDLPKQEKKERIDSTLKYDRDFIEPFQKAGKPVVNLVLQLDPAVSMELAKQRALSTLGGEPDRHESSFDLQTLTVKIYQEICDGKIEGYQAELVRAERGSVRRLYEGDNEPGHLGEMDGITFTGGLIGKIIGEHLWMNKVETGALRGQFMRDADIYTTKIAFSARGEEADFEFRQILGLKPDLGYQKEERLELLKTVCADRPGILRAIEASRRIDERLNIRGERET